MPVPQPITPELLNLLAGVRANGNKKTYSLPSDGSAGQKPNFGNLLASLGLSPTGPQDMFSSGALSQAPPQSNLFPQSVQGPGLPEGTPVPGPGYDQSSYALGNAAGSILPSLVSFLGKLGSGLSPDQSQANAPSQAPSQMPAAPSVSAAPHHNVLSNVPPGLMPTSVPAYDGSKVGAGGKEAGQLAALMSLFGMVSPSYVATTMPLVQKGASDIQEADADKAYQRQRQELMDREGLAGQYQKADLENSQLDAKDAQIQAQLTAAAPKLTEAANKMWRDMYTQMQSAYDPSNPQATQQAQEAIMKAALPGIKTLNPSVDESLFYDSSGNWIPIKNGLKAQTVADKTNTIATQNQKRRAQTLDLAFHTLGTTAFWAQPVSARQGVIHDIETNLGIPLGTLGTPTDPLSFAQKMQKANVSNAAQKTLDAESAQRFKESMDKQKLALDKLNVGSQIADRKSLMASRTWHMLNGGQSKDPNKLTMNQLLTQRNAAIGLASRIQGQIDDPGKKFGRNAQTTQEMQKQVAEAKQTAEYLDGQITDMRNAGNVSGNSGDVGSRIAQEAKAVHDSGGPAEYAGYCEAQTDKIITKIDPSLHTFHRGTAQESMEAFKSHGVGFAYSGQQLQPGDILYTSKWGSTTSHGQWSGHTGIVGPDGMILDNVSSGVHDPSSWPAQWVVRPSQVHKLPAPKSGASAPKKSFSAMSNEELLASLRSLTGK